MHSNVTGFLALLATGLPLHAQCPLDTLVASDSTTGDEFGAMVARDGDRLLVGASGHDQLGAQAGAAYIFERAPGGSWTEAVTLLAPDGDAGDAFGQSVDLLGDLAVVGAPYDEEVALFAGSAYIFERSGTSWVPTAKLTAQDGGPSHTLGSVAIVDMDTVVVGAPGGFSPAGATGAVYVFERLPTGWAQTAKLTPAVPILGGRFGTRLDASGPRLVVGATPLSDGPVPGQAYVFDRIGGTLVQTDVITVNGGASPDLEGDRLLIGSSSNSANGFLSGRASLHERIGGAWVETEVFEPEAPNSLQLFGLAVAFDGTRILIGSREMGGKVYHYEQGASGFEEVATIAPPSPGPGFGSWFVLDGDRALISASYADPGTLHEFLLGPTEEAYCDAVPNSTGGVARMSATGCNAVSDNQLVLVAGPVPNQPGLFYYGAQPVQVPFGPGQRCVGGMAFRLPVLSPQGTQLVHQVDLTAPPVATGLITPGSTWYFQAWFRDPAGVGSFNLSDGLRILFL